MTIMDLLDKLQFFKNKICSSQEEYKTEYNDLSPIENISDGEEYLYALKWAIENPKIRNIALSGPYGSGKSSVFATFLKQNPMKKKKTIQISMASFSSEFEDNEGKITKGKIKISPEEIEEGILKQLFYKVNYTDIPQSRFRKLHKVNLLKSWLCSLIFFLSVLAGCYVLNPLLIFNIKEKIIVAGNSVGYPDWLTFSFLLVLIFCIISTVAIIYRSIISKYYVKEIKLPKDVSVKTDTSPQESVFNKNMDEIVYFFEETKYRIVLFEDLDRLNTPAIFIHLRELNTVLNNCDAIKEPVIFVYAVRDDIFSETERTKFFDFIIPIIPVINATNSGDILLRKLNNSRQIGKSHDVSYSFVMDVAPYIEDMRILQNIYNEFVIYKSTLSLGQRLDLHDEPMLSLIIFKNLFPQDFADIQMETGIIKKAFEDKEQFVSNMNSEISERIASSSSIIENISDEFHDSRKALKAAFLCELSDWNGVVRGFTPQSSREIQAQKFMADDYDVYAVKTPTSCSVYYTTFAGSYASNNCFDFKEKYERFIKKYERISLIEDERIDEEKATIARLKIDIQNNASKSISKLINEYGVDNVLCDNVRKNKLLVFLLRRGYIDEKYANYINYFKGDSITKDDMNFILSVKNLEPKSFNYKLVKTDIVVERLQLYEFKQEAILNFDLLDNLLSSDRNNNKLNCFMQNLSNGKELSWKFIDEFIDLTKHQIKFIRLLADNWIELLYFVLTSDILTYERQIYYLKILLSNISLEQFISMNIDDVVVKFFIEHKDILSKIHDIQDEKVIAIIKNLNIIFEDIDTTNVSDELLNYLFENDHYDINPTMIKKVVEYQNPSLVPKLDSRNYSTILELDFKPLISYIRRNIEIYVDKVFSCETNTEEKLHAVIDLLQCNVGNDNYIGIIETQNFYIDDLTMCCAELRERNRDYVYKVWDLVIKNKKVKPSWNNIFSYWKSFGFTDAILAFIEDTTNELVDDDSGCINDESFISEFIMSNIAVDSFSLLIDKLPWSGFDLDLETIDIDKLEILISKRFFSFTLERYNQLEKASPKLITDFILFNQDEFMQLRDNIKMSAELLESIVLNNKIDSTNIQVLLDEYCEDYMTRNIALNLNELAISVDLKLFKSGWTVLDKFSKETYMLSNLASIDADTFNLCFSEIGGVYSSFVDRTHRRDVTIDFCDRNLALAERLKEVGYITSFEKRIQKEYDQTRKAYRYVSSILCRIKAIS